MTLRERRVLFTRLLGELLLWVGEQPGWEVALDEATVHSPRRIRTSLDGTPGVATYDILHDAVHKHASLHYAGLAADLVLYVEGQYISDGAHPAWLAIARRWESMHPRATSGLRWQDADHVSLGEGERATPL